MGEKDHSDRQLAGEGELVYATAETIAAVRSATSDPIERAALLADVCRLNCLYMIMQAGSGHIGSSFSSMDLITWLWTEELVNPNSGDAGADTYFSSKGHDAPALYSLLIALGKLDVSLLHRLRRLGGLPGHPDIQTPFIATNTGSLGMGISKAYGMVRARRQIGKAGRVVVMTGDGELQEGQIWESLQPVANERLGDIVAIVDHNKYQSDSTVASVSDLGEIEGKFRAFGWEVRRADGHDFGAIRDAFAHFNSIPTDRKSYPRTRSGKGVSFMEGSPAATGRILPCRRADTEGLPRRSRELTAAIDRRLAGGSAADDACVRASTRAHRAVETRAPRDGVRRRAARAGEGPTRDRRAGRRSAVRLRHRSVQGAAAAAVHRVWHRGAAHGVCRWWNGARGTPAGGALVCLLPLTRANEHIYNNATERTKIIYTATLAGLVPAGPGHSHQSVRDISAIGSIPGLVAIEPCCGREARLAIRWAVEENGNSTYLRFVNVPMDLPYTLPAPYTLRPGRGVTLRDGHDVALLGYGPLLMTNAWHAAEELEAQGVSAAVIDLPWLNRLLGKPYDTETLRESRRSSHWTITTSRWARA
jgi:transketolase